MEQQIVAICFVDSDEDRGHHFLADYNLIFQLTYVVIDFIKSIFSSNISPFIQFLVFLHKLNEDPFCFKRFRWGISSRSLYFSSEITRFYINGRRCLKIILQYLYELG